MRAESGGDSCSFSLVLCPIYPLHPFAFAYIDYVDLYEMIPVMMTMMALFGLFRSMFICLPSILLYLISIHFYLTVFMYNTYVHFLLDVLVAYRNETLSEKSTIGVPW